MSSFQLTINILGLLEFREQFDILAFQSVLPTFFHLLAIRKVLIVEEYHWM